MRTTLATALLVVGTMASAYAADLPSRMAPVYAPPLLPVFTWTGGYFGINAGYAFDYGSRFQTFNDPTVPATGAVGAGGVRPRVFSVHSDGFTAGGQIGYNYQFGAGSGVVVGVEADAAYIDLDETRGVSITANGATRVSRFHSDMDFLGTVRGRLGYAFDRFLVYGTGGFAYGDVNERSRFYLANGTTLTYAGERSGLQTGYTYGGGIEYAMPTDSVLNFFHSSAVTLKAEYLHYDLGTSSLSLPAVANNTGVYTQRIRTDGDLARVGLNYKF